MQHNTTTSLQERWMQPRSIVLLIAIAYLFSLAVRMIWVYQFHGVDAYRWHGQIMINTNDGYYFASAAQHLINGAHPGNFRIESAIRDYPVFIYLTAWLSKILPFSFDTIILYMPAFVASLIVIPIVLIGRLLRLPLVGFFAAMLAAISWSFYHRTMVGYYDSDMIALLMPPFLLYGMVGYVHSQYRIRYLAFIIGLLLLYPYVYIQGTTVAYAMFLLWAFYLILYLRKESTFETLFAIAVVSVALWSQALWVKVFAIAITILLRAVIKTRKIENNRLYLLLALYGLLFFFLSDIAMVSYAKLKAYTTTGTATNGFHFYSVSQTIREAGKISWQTVANRISAGMPQLLFSMIGYLLLLYRYRIMIVALPLLGLGIGAHWLGLRFTVYAIPIAAFSLVYLVREIVFMAAPKSRLALPIFSLLSLLFTIPHIKHVFHYGVPTVMQKAEVQVLDQLRQVAKPNDFTITWWDYGYPLWYYGNTRTLIDGGKHNHDNFIVSNVLLSDSPAYAARFLRLSVESYAKMVDSYRDFLKTLDRKQIPKPYRMVDKEGRVYHAGGGAVIDFLLRSGQKDQKDTDSFFETLEEGKLSLPKRSRDIYLYLPYRMIDIFPTVMLFGNIDLSTGEKLYDPVFAPGYVVKRSTNGTFLLSNGIIVDTLHGILRIGRDTKKIRRFDMAIHLNDGTIKKSSRVLSVDGELNVVYLRSFNRMIMMDPRTYRSLFVQMFMLGNYDPNYFEPVVVSPLSRIYRLKR